MQRKIIHIDMDAFFAAVEIRDNPQLRGKPIAVGGKAQSRGVISTCSYEARQFGVRSAMATAEALRRCPDLIVVPTRMAAYKEVSSQIRAIFAHYTPLVEPLSLDEAYLDVSQCLQCRGSATLIAENIRQNIVDETGLTASAGVAPNKFLAKIASDENKPNGQYVITPDYAATFAAEMPLRKIPGVGLKTAQHLAALGLHQGRDVLHWTVEHLMREFGKFGSTLYQRVRGIDERAVQATRERKSVGIETTLAQDVSTEAACLTVLDALLAELERRRQKRHFSGVHLKMKFHDFKQTTVSTQASAISRSLVQSLLHAAYQRAQGRRIRLLGISVTLATSLEHQGRQLSLDFG